MFQNVMSEVVFFTGVFCHSLFLFPRGAASVQDNLDAGQVEMQENVGVGINGGSMGAAPTGALSSQSSELLSDETKQLKQILERELCSRDEISMNGWAQVLCASHPRRGNIWIRLYFFIVSFSLALTRRTPLLASGPSHASIWHPGTLKRCALATPTP